MVGALIRGAHPLGAHLGLSERRTRAGMRAFRYARAWDVLAWEAHAPQCPSVRSSAHAPRRSCPGARPTLLFQLIIPFLVNCFFT